MRTLLIAVLFVLTGCTTHYSFMDKALVGYVDNQAVVVLPAGERNGVKYYRPQFQSDCHYNKMYQTDNTSTGCMIRASRIVGLQPYSKHKNEVKPRRVDNIHGNLDDVNSTIYIPDNI